MVENEPTNESVDTGKKPDPISEKDKPVSLYDKTEAIVKRQEEANKKTEELLARQETLHANERLAGTAGGHVEPAPEKKPTDEEYAKDFMEGKVNPLKDDGIVQE